MSDEFDKINEQIRTICRMSRREYRMTAIQDVLRDPNVSDVKKRQVREFFWNDHPEYIAKWNKTDMFFSSKFDEITTNEARKKYADKVLRNPSASAESKLAVKKIMLTRPWQFDNTDRRDFR